MAARRGLVEHHAQREHVARGVGAGAAQRADIAVTIVGGQSLCLFLTLLLVPVSYSLAEEAAERAKNVRRARRTGVAESPAS